MEVKAFKAVRFNADVVGDTGKCISPPYDVIEDSYRERLYERSDHNVVRIIKGEESVADNDDYNKYSRAGKYFNDWLASGALKQDDAESIYAYVQNFCIEGQEFCRSGFIALGKLTEFGEGVQPHEKTLEGPKADRLNLMRATAGQFGQIFMIYDDTEQVADKAIAASATKAALVDYTDQDEVRHRLFAIEADEDIKAIQTMMSSRDAIIADGHHRYETALNYCRESENPAAEHRMMTFVNLRNEGLIVLPTHRLVSNLPDFDLDTLITKLGSEFDITEYKFEGKSEKVKARQKAFAEIKMQFEDNCNSFVLYAGTDSFYTVTLSDKQAMNVANASMSNAAKGLDVNVLHTLILDKQLGIGEKQLAEQSNLKYIKDIGDAIQQSIAKVDSKESQAVFFMNPTRNEQVQAIAAAGEKMPQKSTFYYPKIFTGLTINKL
jgi:uncharacterized protein (DUF1015 family)